MSMITRPASTTYASLIYITAGALTIVWSGVWLWYLQDSPPHSKIVLFLCYGCLFSGIVVFGIGMAVGQIGRAARNAELPPEEVTAAVARTDQEAARHPAIPVATVGGAIIPGTTASGVVAAPPVGQVVTRNV